MVGNAGKSDGKVRSKASDAMTSMVFTVLIPLLSPQLACARTATQTPDAPMLAAADEGRDQAERGRDQAERGRDRAERVREQVERARERAERVRERVERGRERGDRTYESGGRALDRRDFAEAVTRFDAVATAGQARADGALYWKAYALAKLGRGGEATAALDELARKHPRSPWLNDAKVMRVEIAQAGGKPLAPEDASDDEMKLMAINALVQSDPERTVPLLEKLLAKPSAPKLRERALFVLSQSDSPKAREAVVRVARGGANPDLQLIAVRNLGLYGGKESKQVLADLYGSSNDPIIKRQVLHGFMVGGERERMLAIAKGERNLELRKEAIHFLGTMGANAELAQLYGAEPSPEVRQQLMHALFVGGNTAKLIEIAKTEKDRDLRARAIHHLGTTDAAAAGEALAAIYGSNQDTETRRAVLDALFVQNNARLMVALARKESNPDLKKEAVSRLSNMRSKEATDFLLELLNK
jgi:HEAT repeat protein